MLSKFLNTYNKQQFVFVRINYSHRVFIYLGINPGVGIYLMAYLAIVSYQLALFALIFAVINSDFACSFKIFL